LSGTMTKHINDPLPTKESAPSTRDTRIGRMIRQPDRLDL